MEVLGQKNRYFMDYKEGLDDRLSDTPPLAGWCTPRTLLLYLIISVSFVDLVGRVVSLRPTPVVVTLRRSDRQGRGFPTPE